MKAANQASLAKIQTELKTLPLRLFPTFILCDEVPFLASCPKLEIR